MRRPQEGQRRLRLLQLERVLLQPGEGHRARRTPSPELESRDRVKLHPIRPGRRVPPPGVGMCPEVQLAPPVDRIRGCRAPSSQVGMAEHLLNAAEVGAALEQVRGEGVAQQVRVDAARVEPGLLGQPAQDQEGARAGQRRRRARSGRARAGGGGRGAAARARGSGARASAAGRPSGTMPLLAALADDAHEPLVEVDGRALEPERLGDAQPRAVEQLDQGAVAQRARRRRRCAASTSRSASAAESVRGSLPGPPRQLERRGRVVGARAEQLQVLEEARTAACAARSSTAARPSARSDASQRSSSSVVTSPTGRPSQAGERGEVAAVRLDGARRAPRGEEEQEALERQDRGWAWS